jgi:hypothetical protein
MVFKRFRNFRMVSCTQWAADSQTAIFRTLTEGPNFVHLPKNERCGNSPYCIEDRPSSNPDLGASILKMILVLYSPSR